MMNNNLIMKIIIHIFVAMLIVVCLGFFLNAGDSRDQEQRDCQQVLCSWSYVAPTCAIVPTAAVMLHYHST